MSQVPYAELQRVVDRFLDEARKYPGRAEPADRPAPEHARKCASRSTATSSPTSASRSTRSARTLETMLGGRQVTRFKKDGEQYDVIVQVAPVDRSTPADISDSYVRARDGSMVQLSNLVDVRERRRAAVAQSLQPPARGQDHRHARAGLRDRRGAARRWTTPPSAALPPPRRPTSTASRAEFRKSGGEIYFTFVLALMFIYLVLAGAVRKLRAVRS